MTRGVAVVAIEQVLEGSHGMDGLILSTDPFFSIFMKKNAFFLFFFFFSYFVDSAISAARYSGVI